MGNNIKQNPRNIQLGVRLTKSESQLLRRLAADHGKTQSATVREMIRGHLRQLPKTWLNNQ